MRKIQKILVGIDFSEYSREAARYAVLFGKTLEAEVTFVHICEQAAFLGSGFGPYQMASMKQYVNKQKKNEANSLDEMKRFVGEFEKEEIKISYHIASGQAPVEIIRIANEDNADMIVLGTHGRRSISQLIIGSVAEKVVRKASCPVLTVKLTTQNFPMSI